MEDFKGPYNFETGKQNNFTSFLDTYKNGQKQNTFTAPLAMNPLIAPVNQNSNTAEQNITSEEQTRAQNMYEVMERVKQYPVTDNVVIGYDEAVKFTENITRTMPVYELAKDLLLSKQIPIPSLEMHINIQAPHDPKVFTTMPARVVIFEDLLEEVVHGEENVVGLIRIKSIGAINNEDTWGSIWIGEENQIGFAPLANTKNGKVTKILKNSDALQDEYGEMEYSRLYSEVMNIWCAIQMSMLHPKLKYIFEHPKMIPLDSNGKKTKKNRAVRYVKKHKISMADLDKTLFPYEKEKGSHTITCPYWWVIGHWHTYRGKKKWVKGYWKGALRDTKQKHDENRERKIDTENICI